MTAISFGIIGFLITLVWVIYMQNIPSPQSVCVWGGGVHVRAFQRSKSTDASGDGFSVL